MNNSELFNKKQDIVAHAPADLSRIYSRRFLSKAYYRKNVWEILVRSYFSKFIQPSDSVLDLGCGYGEFINCVVSKKRFAMDLNPDAPKMLDEHIKFLYQDCSSEWPEDTNELDVVFSSNFFEHLPDKIALGRTLDQVYKSLKNGGVLIAMGPNIRFINGAYWDFWDHYIPLTDRSLGEALENRGFKILLSCARFLPYTMSGKVSFPSILIKVYLKFPMLWKIFGKQFFIIAKKQS